METPNQFKLLPEDHNRLLLLSGYHDENIRLIENRLGIIIKNRGNTFTIVGPTRQASEARSILHELYEQTKNGVAITPDEVHLMIHKSQQNIEKITNEISLHSKIGYIRTRNKSQQDYLKKILTHDINFAIGPAGTGKTYLAVACAVDALESEQISRIILVRPAVEAGERLGFLPGDLSQKVDPYLRPLYDALYEMMGFEKVARLIEKQIIEIAPLAYMRGRTLNHAFIILDEGQNTTPEQMKMFLTRVGFGSKVVVTGDITQIDLAKDRSSGLLQVNEVLRDVPGISFSSFDSKDVVRHPLVQHIIEAYEKNNL